MSGIPRQIFQKQKNLLALNQHIKLMMSLKNPWTGMLIFLELNTDKEKD